KERKRQRYARDRRIDLVDPADVEMVRRHAEEPAERGEALVDGAVVRVEHVPPHRGDDERRNDDRKDEDRSVETAEAQARRVQYYGDEDSDRHMKDHVREGPEEVEREHSPEAEVGD